MNTKWQPKNINWNNNNNNSKQILRDCCNKVYFGCVTCLYTLHLLNWIHLLLTFRLKHNRISFSFFQTSDFGPMGGSGIISDIWHWSFRHFGNGTEIILFTKNERIAFIQCLCHQYTIYILLNHVFDSIQIVRFDST